jgi:hypothetical protein
MSGYAMAEFLKLKQVQRRTLKSFLLTQADRVKQHALSIAAEAQRPHQYLTGPTHKEDLARQIAERDGITEGLVCVFSVLEPRRTFSLVWKEAHPFVQPAWRKCLHLYFCVVDHQLGLIHVKLQTWFPFPIQVYGNEWVARRLDRHGVRYQKRDNVFVHVSLVTSSGRSNWPMASPASTGCASSAATLGGSTRCCATCWPRCSTTG